MKAKLEIGLEIDFAINNPVITARMATRKDVKIIFFGPAQELLLDDEIRKTMWFKSFDTVPDRVENLKDN